MIMLTNSLHNLLELHAHAHIHTNTLTKVFKYNKLGLGHTGHSS